MMETAENTSSGANGWPVLGHFWTVPNILTLSRLVLVVVITYLILTKLDLVGDTASEHDGALYWVFALILVAVATDWFDGKVARWSHTVSEWGKVLDPLVDKIGAGSVVLALFIKGALPGWFLLVMVVRDVLILLGGVVLARKTGRVVVSLWAGKVAVTAVAMTVLAALMRADPPVMTFCIWVTTALLVYSYLRYMARYFRLLRMGPLPSSSINVTVDSTRAA